LLRSLVAGRKPDYGARRRKGLAFYPGKGKLAEYLRKREKAQWTSRFFGGKKKHQNSQGGESDGSTAEAVT